MNTEPKCNYPAALVVMERMISAGWASRVSSSDEALVMNFTENGKQAIRHLREFVSVPGAKALTAHEWETLADIVMQPNFSNVDHPQ